MAKNVLVIKRKLKCSKRQLFDAWSQASIISQWFFASPEKVKESQVSSSFSVGGDWSVTMFFEDGSTSSMHGEYKEIIRYSKIAFSWSSAIASGSLVELHFRELSPNRSELKLVHSQLESENSVSLHEKGWLACLQNLDCYINESLN